MKSHLNKHFNDIRDLRLEYNTGKDKLEGEIGPIFTDIMSSMTDICNVGQMKVMKLLAHTVDLYSLATVIVNIC